MFALCSLLPASYVNGEDISVVEIESRLHLVELMNCTVIRIIEAGGGGCYSGCAGVNEINGGLTGHNTDSSSKIRNNGGVREISGELSIHFVCQYLVRSDMLLCQSGTLNSIITLLSNMGTRGRPSPYIITTSLWCVLSTTWCERSSS